VIYWLSAQPVWAEASFPMIVGGLAAAIFGLVLPRDPAHACPSRQVASA
jgi:hypothetical protein